MHLTERERERLLLAAGADLARRRLARGARLGAVEAVALVCDEILEWAWDGVDHAEVQSRARQLVPREALLPGVAALAPFVQVEALFPYGCVLVHVVDPFGPLDEDAADPEAGAGASDPARSHPGQILPGQARVALAPGRRRGVARVENTGHAPIWVSSHTPLVGLNEALAITLPAEPAGASWRLDLPAGMSRRFDPQEGAHVGVVVLEGEGHA